MRMEPASKGFVKGTMVDGKLLRMVEQGLVRPTICSRRPLPHSQHDAGGITAATLYTICIRESLKYPSDRLFCPACPLFVGFVDCMHM